MGFGEYFKSKGKVLVTIFSLIMLMLLSVKSSHALFFDFVARIIQEGLGLTETLIRMIPLYLVFGILIFTLCYYGLLWVKFPKRIRIVIAIIFALLVILVTPDYWWLLIAKMWSTILVWGFVALTFVAGYYLFYHNGGILAKEGGRVTRGTHLFRLIGLILYFTIAEMILMSVYSPVIEFLLGIISLLILYEFFAFVFHGSGSSQDDIADEIVNLSQKLNSLKKAKDKIANNLKKQKKVERRSFNELKKELNKIESGLTGYDIGQDLNIIFGKIKALINYLKNLMDPNQFDLKDFDAAINELNKVIEELEETLRKYHDNVVGKETTQLKELVSEVERFRKQVVRYFVTLKKEIEDLLKLNKKQEWPEKYKGLSKKELQRLLSMIDAIANQETAEFNKMLEELNNMLMALNTLDKQTEQILTNFKQFDVKHPGPLMEIIGDVKSGKLESARTKFDALLNSINNLQTDFVRHVEDKRAQILSVISKVREALDEVMKLDNKLRAKGIEEWLAEIQEDIKEAKTTKGKRWKQKRQ